MIATGNGAAYYVAQALWLASLDGRRGAPVVAVPGGLVAGGRFNWRPGDRLLAISSSGEFRDVIDAVEQGAPRPVACVTAKPESSLGKLADGRAVQTVLNQRALTHTQAFCGGVATALAVWARVTGDDGLQADGAGRCAGRGRARHRRDRALHGAQRVASGAERRGGVRLGPGLGGGARGRAVPEGGRDGADRGLRDPRGRHHRHVRARRGHIVLSLATRDDALLDEAERVCATRGATVVRLPGGDEADRRIAPITALPAITAFAAALAITGGHDADHPSWEAAYYQTARRK